MTRRISLALLVPVAIACSEAGDSAESPSSSSSSSGGVELFGESVEGEPCDLLTTEIVSETVSVPAEDIRQSSMISCNYFFGDDGMIFFFGVQVFEDVEGAIERLAATAEGVTAEELATMWDDIVDQARERVEGREGGATEATGAAVAGEAAEAVTFEAAPGLGDRGVWETGTSSATVQVANAVIRLQATTGGGLEADRELARQLVDAVVEHLRQRNGRG